MSQERILVTGGMGYIGSQVVPGLIEAGHSVTILDDFSTGTRSPAHPVAELIEGNVGNGDLVSDILCTRQIGTAIHLAASTLVPEPVDQLLKYFQNNVAYSLTLIDACVALARRPGDPAIVIADSNRQKRRCHWTPRHSDLETIIASGLAWDGNLVHRHDHCGC